MKLYKGDNKLICLFQSHILKTPNFVASGVFLMEADKHKPSTFLVSAGSMMPSSQSLAVE